MKLLNREQIESLANIKCKDRIITSFFLDTSKNRLTKKEILLGCKNLLNNARLRLDVMAIDKAVRESAVSDIEKIRAHCSRILPGYNDVGLSIFSCSGGKVWREFNLVKSPRNLIVFDRDPYVRPLSAILEEYHRVCTLTLDRKEARWHDVFMGEIFFLENLEGDVPSRIREGGWEGYSSKRIERHAASRMRDFLKQIAKRTFELMKEHHFEWLFIGCRDEIFQELEPLLHPYLKQRFKARIKAGPGDPPDQVLKKALELKNRLKREEKEVVVRRFINELGKNGLAVSGLKTTLQSLNRGKLQTLLVTRNVSHPGMSCPRCGFLFEDENECPSCRVKTLPVPDVVDDAVAKALNSSSLVIHINPPTELDGFGGVGAFLRYKA